MALGPQRLLMAGGGSGTTWTPNVINGAGLRFWYDGVGSVSGSSLLDLSTIGNTLTKSGTVNTATETRNGINVLQHVGGRYTAASASLHTYLHDGTAQVVIMAACKFGTTSNPNAFYGLFGTNGTSSGKIGVTMYYDDNAANERFAMSITKGSSGNPRAQRLQDNTITSNAWHVVDVKLGAGESASTDRLLGGIDGVDVFGTYSAALGAQSTSAPTHPLQIGDVGGSVGPLTGAIAEIFCFDLGTVTLADARGYLQQKYAI